MIKGEYKRVLFDIFDVLEFMQSEKEEALETFKKKLAFELLESVKGELPQDQQGWLSQAAPDMGDPKFVEIQNTIKGMYTNEQLYEKSKPIFKKLLEDYVAFMSQGISIEEVAKLKEIAGAIA
ncbi:MAG: hypothetical protein HYX22_03625 [Candidatus Yanofskybacteria bacterium]|nr:hypothetical protein [Candidatus Yanofskybacteria bacterium]